MHRKGSLGWTEPIVLLSRGRPLNSRHLERVRRPTTGQKPGNRRSDPSIGSNERCPAPAWFDPSIGPNGPCPAPAWSDPSFGPTDYAQRQLGLTLPSIPTDHPCASLCRLRQVSFDEASNNQSGVPVTATGHCPVPVLSRSAKTSFPGRGATPLRCVALSRPKTQKN